MLIFFIGLCNFGRVFLKFLIASHHLCVDCSFTVLRRIYVFILLTAPTYINAYFPEKENKNAYLFYRDNTNIFDNERFTKSGRNSDYGFVARVCHVSYIAKFPI